VTIPEASHLTVESAAFERTTELLFKEPCSTLSLIVPSEFRILLALLYEPVLYSNF
jgi:hypothetical protein